MAAYYNENDPKTAAWLRELIRQRLIADGEVDDRSIELVRPDDLRGFVQCHFFAGIGGWSYALRLAGWTDDREVWTGSCPCQPFSMAGEGKGVDDPRHLWPTWKRLIEVSRPATIFGEQTASLDGLYWLDLVYADLEAQDYAIGTFDISGACIGSPDIRPRLWFVADTDRALVCEQPHTRPEPLHDALRGDSSGLADAERMRTGRGTGSEGRAQREAPSGGKDERGRVVQTLDTGATRGLADSEYAERRPFVLAGHHGQHGAHGGWTKTHGESRARGQVRGLADNNGERLERRDSIEGIRSSAVEPYEREGVIRGGLAGVWADNEWIWCRPEPRYPEGCWRPIEPGSFPLATGIPARILRLRGYGNSIKPWVAKEVIAAYMEIANDAP